MALRGVNLGGWLVLERWMTPSVFAGTEATDEYTFMQAPDARGKLREHQKNFIRESDFKWLRDNGIEAVRIPVGYWVMDGDAPYAPCVGRLDWAFRMAEKYGLEVLLCLHGAPGSQNGQDHSGQVGAARWYKQREYRAQTVEVLEQLALRYRDNPKFWGIELLNEPRAQLLQLKLRRFYRTAYRRLTSILRPHTRIVFHDAFTPRLMNAALGGARAAMDIHWYHFTFWAHKWAPLRAYWWVVWWHGQLAANLRHWQGIVIGEWSGVIGHERLRRYGAGERARVEHEHITRQLAAYAHADAWFYWNYKTEGNDVWNFRDTSETYPDLFADT